MLHKIIKRLLLIQLLLGCVVMLTAQVEKEYYELTAEPDDNQNYIARDYVKLKPNFHYKASGQTTATNPEFGSHMEYLYMRYTTKGIPTTPVIRSLPPHVFAYVYSHHSSEANDFIEFLEKTTDYDDSKIEPIDVAPTYFKAAIDRSLVFDADYLGSINPSPRLPFSTSNAIGSLPGSVNVSPSGAATYTIPVTLPPGTAGIMPNLSIVYNSQSPSGMLGLGWTIGGFSAITRVPANLHDDSKIEEVNFSSNDRFALDGNRVVEIDGAYGEDGTEYRTKVETYSRIYSYGRKGNGPEKFIVETKDGKTLEYDSRFVANGQNDVIMWLLNKVTDISGNYYTT